MPFGMVSWVGRGMNVLDEGCDHQRARGNFGVSHCKQWGHCCIVVRERHALPKLLWGELVNIIMHIYISPHTITV